MKYNYVLSAALDSGVAIGVVLIFFCLQYPKNGTIGSDNVQVWWGNTYVVVSPARGLVLLFYLTCGLLFYSVPFTTADALGTPLLSVSDGQIFG
jgi:hypothetical protein